MKTIKKLFKIAKYLICSTSLIPYLLVIGLCYIFLTILFFVSGAIFLLALFTVAILLYIFIFIISVQFFNELYYTFKNKLYNINLK